MLDQPVLRHWRSPAAMACSPPMSKRKAANEDTPRACRPRSAGELVGEVGGQSFKRFGFVQSSIVSRWAEIVGERYARVSSPEIDPLPARPQGGRRADPAGRRRPCAADPASRAADHRAGQPFLRPCGHRPHHLPPGQAAGAGRRRSSGRRCAPCPRNLARACAKSPIPSFAPAWSRLPRKLPLVAARRRSQAMATSPFR